MIIISKLGDICSTSNLMNLFYGRKSNNPIITSEKITNQPNGTQKHDISRRKKYFIFIFVAQLYQDVVQHYVTF